MAASGATGYHPGQAWNKLCPADVQAALRALKEPIGSWFARMIAVALGCACGWDMDHWVLWNVCST